MDGFLVVIPARCVRGASVTLSSCVGFMWSCNETDERARRVPLTTFELRDTGFGREKETEGCCLAPRVRKPEWRSKGQTVLWRYNLSPRHSLENDCKGIGVRRRQTRKHADLFRNPSEGRAANPRVSVLTHRMHQARRKAIPRGGFTLNMGLMSTVTRNPAPERGRWQRSLNRA